MADVNMNDSSYGRDRLELLREAFLDSKPPYCAGTLSLPPEDLIIFYGKEDPGSCGRIDFSNVTNEDLERLSEVCDKATFGRKQEDVLDESYRKAGKLDSSYFATKIDPERSGLINFVRFNLLDGDLGRSAINAELYKLNIYGQDSFFKAHKDTPRSTEMFGSLVIVLPTPHEGGELFLRHDEREWSFDSGKEIVATRDPKTHVGYIAFYSDVEHEVALVKSGYRVTLTFNLYWDDNAVRRKLDLTKDLPPDEFAVKDALQELLNDELFYPEGIHLAFGLNHEYPVQIKPFHSDTLSFIARNLKGSDALLMKACRELNLDAQVNLYYVTSMYHLLIPREVRLEGRLVYDLELGEYLRGECGGKVVKTNEGDEIDFEMEWVTERTDFNALEDTYLAHGNEPSLEYAYGRFCLVVNVGPVGERATVTAK